MIHLPTPSFWRERTPTSLLLYPLSLIYRLAVRLRRRFARPQRVKARVLCIGNLVAGGAGKTPTAVALGKWAAEKKLRACYVSRGYGGALKGPLRVDPENHSGADVGDEPLLLARVLPSYIAKDRLRGAQLASEEGFDLIILDDGFQNLSLHKDFSLLVVDAAYGMGNGFCLPAGPLREPEGHGFGRADAVLLLSRPTRSATTEWETPPNLPTIKAELEASFSESVADVPLVAFSGIAHPGTFFATLEAAGGVLVHSRSFADHHPFSEKELQRLYGIAKERDARLITTAKDAARLSGPWRDQLIIADLHLSWQNPAEVDNLLGELTEGIRHGTD